jgi:hypothetical protein
MQNGNFKLFQIINENKPFGISWLEILMIMNLVSNLNSINLIDMIGKIHYDIAVSLLYKHIFLVIINEKWPWKAWTERYIEYKMSHLYIFCKRLENQ